jgi:hypothetical protein
VKDAGLSVEIKSVERSKDDGGGADYVSFPEGSLLDVSPALGSVIDVGGTVTVTSQGGLRPSTVRHTVPEHPHMPLSVRCHADERELKPWLSIRTMSTSSAEP